MVGQLGVQVQAFDIKLAEPPGSQYASTAAGRHEIHILSLIFSLQEQVNKSKQGCRTLHTVRKEKGG